MPADWTPRDLQRFARHGVSVDEMERQLQLFERPPYFLHLDRPCTVGDGIRPLDAAAQSACLEAYEGARAAGRFLKFVPASGAASRMFAPLLAALYGGISLRRADLEARHDEIADEVLRFAASLPQFAFYPLLRQSMRAQGLDLDALLQAGHLQPVLEHLLASKGLSYAELPKALLPFHRHPRGPRTALEEHLEEAARTIADRHGTCRLHFTVAPEARARFERLVDSVRPAVESRHGVRLDIGFSSQKPSTDTLAVDMDNRPFRSADGELVLRPGGHGALLENLQDLDADLVVIKNIDNVTTEDQLADTVRWKKILGGYLCQMQERLFGHLRRLAAAGDDSATLPAALRFARDDLGVPVPAAIASAPPAAQRDFLRRRLERPLRVCGMVRNLGEPGGGPLWVRDADGLANIQIVERAQIDVGSAEQRAIFDSMTHFSPVDLVCALRDAAQHPYALARFVDRAAVFIAEKSSEGRKLRALEHPGLWNGGMAHWITLLVEVPDSTFNPVKTITDLLRPAHQPR